MERGIVMIENNRYLQRLNDGRNIWLDGDIVKNLDEHPAFKGTVHTIQSLLDLQTKPDSKSLLTYQTEEGLDANLSFLVPRTHEDLEKNVWRTSIGPIRLLES